MVDKYRELLAIPVERLQKINDVLTDPGSRVMNDFLDLVAKYGTPEEINKKWFLVFTALINILNRSIY